ncbi:acyl carrier protein [Weissella tructae]|uniref:Acyl carrier protein n=2 Tax=Weissella TaxID=46255 RepID=A0A075U5W3_9LACO|nr:MULTISPECIES: acyl carrier protein [Weissella]AIG65507.1 Acyl carrier protein [Weissella tructae]AIM62821.1 Acyl carrier protein [Weissella ceti]AIM64156.1 Acyl carrier protein [Weissella ceti]ELA07034.1 acyl carrier protein [Weissella ceti NC36]QVV91879.1 acyl carrier protein [Weissella tructae]
MTNDMIFNKVQAILMEQFDLEEAEVTLTTDMANDIDADSLDLFEVLNQVEDEFDIQLAVAENITTVESLVQKIAEELAANA